MQAKDWILLLIPIVCNGFLIFTFQSIIERKLKKGDRRVEYIKIIIQTASELVCEENEKVSLLIHEYSMGYNPQARKDPAPFDELWNPIAKQAVKIYDYYQLHREVFRKKEVQIEQFIQTYENLSQTCGTLYERQLTEQDQAIISQCVFSFQKSVIDLNTLLEKALLEA